VSIYSGIFIKTKTNFYKKKFLKGIKMDLQLKGKKVLVTGGSKGIGLAIAAAFAAAPALPFGLDCWLVLRPRPFFFVLRDAWVRCGGGCCAGRLLEAPLGPG
jgi:hypothetical protein